jgi:hypothetical protein
MSKFEKIEEVTTKILNETLSPFMEVMEKYLVGKDLDSGDKMCITSSVAASFVATMVNAFQDQDIVEVLLVQINHSLISRFHRACRIDKEKMIMVNRKKGELN